MALPQPESLTPTRERTAEEIRSLLARRRLSGLWLAREVGRSQSYMSRRLTGEVAFDTDDLDAIATALRVPIRVLMGLGGGGNPPPPSTPTLP